ncbi:MAG: hypothetical protein JWL83_1820, partial [Actinomycetia bacterium]|nr:hypothetical protein [Actinomycetes bacterium]
MAAGRGNGSTGDPRARVWPTYPFTTVWPPSEQLPAAAGDLTIPADGQAKVGVCCSGGGIRSAAFSLGSLQELSDVGELARARYLAGVSGGSYIASAFALAARYSDPETIKDGKPGPYAPGSPEEQYVRNRCSYLAVGLGGKARLVAEVFVGVLANIALLTAFLWSIGRPLGWAYAYRNPALRVGTCSASGAARSCARGTSPGWLIGTAALAAIGLALLAGVVRQALRAAGAREKSHRTSAKRKAVYGAHLMVGDASFKFVTTAAFTLIGIALIVALALAPPHARWLRVAIAIGAAAGLGIAVVARIVTMRSATRAWCERVALALLGASGVAAIAYNAIPALILSLRGDHVVHVASAHAGTAGQQAGASKLKWIGSITGGTAVATIFTQLGTLFRRAR